MKYAIVGEVQGEEEKKELVFIAKLFVVGQRARVLAQQINSAGDKNGRGRKAK